MKDVSLQRGTESQFTKRQDRKKISRRFSVDWVHQNWPYLDMLAGPAIETRRYLDEHCVLLLAEDIILWNYQKTMSSVRQLAVFTLVLLSLTCIFWKVEAAMPTLSQCESDLHSLLPDCIQVAAGIPVNFTESVINAVTDCGSEVLSAVSCIVGNLADYTTACSSELSAAGSCLSSTLNTTSV